MNTISSDSTTNSISIYVKGVQMSIVLSEETAYSLFEPMAHTLTQFAGNISTDQLTSATRLPRETDHNRYALTARWLTEEKQLGRDHLKTCGYNIQLLADNLSNLFDWPIESSSLRKAISRFSSELK